MNEMNNSGVSIKRGETFNLDFGMVKGSEQGGIRPVMIVQNDIGNKYSPTVIVVPFTSQITKAKLPTHVEVEAGQFGLTKDSVVLCEQIRTVDKSRLKEKLGEVSDEVISKIEEAIETSINLGKSKQKFESRAEKDIRFRAEYIKELEITIANTKMVAKGEVGQIIVDKFEKMKDQAMSTLQILCKQNKIDFGTIYHPYQNKLAI